MTHLPTMAPNPTHHDTHSYPPMAEALLRVVVDDAPDDVALVPLQLGDDLLRLAGQVDQPVPGGS